MTLTEAQTTLNAETTVKQEKEQGLQELVYNLVTRFLAENKSKNIDDVNLPTYGCNNLFVNKLCTAAET